MSAEEVSSHIDSVDRRTRDGEDVAASERSINITHLYRRYGWGGGLPSPLPRDAQQKLKISDRTMDNRWSRAFGNGRYVAVYRSLVGYYWLLRFDSALSEHWLDHIGTAHDTAERFGGG